MPQIQAHKYFLILTMIMSICDGMFATQKILGACLYCIFGSHNEIPIHNPGLIEIPQTNSYIGETVNFYSLLSGLDHRA